MSETLIPGYYNTKINNHDWHIYIGGEKYFPAYPVKWIEPGKKIIKRYLIIDSSYHLEYNNDEYNKYPLTLLEALVNENDETMNFNGKTYYLWKSYSQNGNNSILEETNHGSNYGNLYLLTTTLEPNLPLTQNSPEIAYFITSDTERDWKDYMMQKHISLAQVDEYDDGERKVRMSNVGARLYNYEHSSWLVDERGVENPVDYFQYDGETMEWEGQTCYVWNRYDNNRLCTQSGWNGDYQSQKILTNTLWITSLPFTMNSQEFVAFINDDTYIDRPSDIPFDRIEYQPNNVYSTSPIEMTYTEEIKEIPNVRTVLWCGEPYGQEVDYYEYSGELMNWDGQQCYVWYLYGTYSENYYCQKLLTNTIDIELPFSEYSDEVVARLSDEDVIADYTKTRHIQYIEKTNDVVGDTIIEKHVTVK